MKMIIGLISFLLLSFIHAEDTAKDITSTELKENKIVKFHRDSKTISPIKGGVLIKDFGTDIDKTYKIKMMNRIDY